MTVSPPTDLRYHRKSRILEVLFEPGIRFELSAEYLRVNSPSAEVRGHGPGQGVVPTGKADVGIDRIDPKGHYAIALVFSDGHDSGIYTWDYLYQLGMAQSVPAHLQAEGKTP
jgi:DUF971 family protein